MPDQIARMRRLICAFVVRIWHKTRFRSTWPRVEVSRWSPSIILTHLCLQMQSNIVVTTSCAMLCLSFSSTFCQTKVGDKCFHAYVKGLIAFAIQNKKCRFRDEQ